jgi:hypothetical protein
MNTLSYWVVETKEWFSRNTNWVCWLFGHTFVWDYKWDYRQAECERCGVHEFDAYFEPDSPAIFFRIYRLRNLFTSGKLRCDRCTDCGKLEHVLGRRVGNHQDCVPF